MAEMTQGFTALLDVYVRQYRAGVKAELASVNVNYRPPDGIAALDQDIDVLLQICGQVDRLLAQGNDGRQVTYTQSKMLALLVEANAGAVRNCLTAMAPADLRYIASPCVAVLDQAKLKASAKRLLDIDTSFLNNVSALVGQVSQALASGFPKPPPQPVNPPPDIEPPDPMERDGGSGDDDDDIFSLIYAPTGPADVFDTSPSPMDMAADLASPEI